MNPEATTRSMDAIDAALAAATPSLDEDGQRRAAAGIPSYQAEAALRSWPAVFWDDQGRVTGFWGLALAAMPHRIRRAGTDLGAWCAWDPLFLARVIGDLDVATADPVTGQAITYRIGGDGTITAASHPNGVLSFLRPGQPWDDGVITSFGWASGGSPGVSWRRCPRWAGARGRDACSGR